MLPEIVHHAAERRAKQRQQRDDRDYDGRIADAMRRLQRKALRDKDEDRRERGPEQRRTELDVERLVERLGPSHQNRAPVKLARGEDGHQRPDAEVAGSDEEQHAKAARLKGGGNRDRHHAFTGTRNSATNSPPSRW